MPEILLHYIWQQRIFAAFDQFTTDGRRVEVLSVGEHNRDAGPDFLNVHLRLDGQDWFGNVEIHVHSTDWYHHHHDCDAAYDSVILHVVRDADREVLNSRGELIPQCSLRYPVDEDYLSDLLRDARLMDSALSVHECGRRLLAEPSLLTDGWKLTLLRHRLSCKEESVRRLLAITQNSWEHAFYISLAHYFGFHTNGLPFEQLAIATPLRFLQKHRNNLFQLTAMLLGQSGLLPELDSPDKNALLTEYQFLKTKFSLSPIEPHLWKYLRLRPQNFPEVRIRQFAHLLYQSEHLFSQLMEAKSLSDLVELFTLKPLPADSYPSLALAPQIGTSSIHILIINTVIPYLFARGEEQKAIRFLEEIPAEQNSVIRQWKLLGQSVHSAADTQALIHLYQNYCSSSRCINCEVAYQIFLSTNVR